MCDLSTFQLNNNGVIPNQRSGRISNAGISIKDVFNANGGPSEVNYITTHRFIFALFQSQINYFFLYTHSKSTVQTVAAPLIKATNMYSKMTTATRCDWLRVIPINKCHGDRIAAIQDVCRRRHSNPLASLISILLLLMIWRKKTKDFFS